jgi:hypothetical protein
MEEWKAVVGTWGYEISDLGNARCFRTMGGRPSMSARMLTPIVSGRYRAVNIDRKMRRIGVLVLEAFVGPRPAGMDCCHGPKGQRDDSLTNVSWGTKSKNLGEDRRRDGTARFGEKTNLAKLTEAQVLEILRRYSEGETIGSLSDEFASCFGNVWHIVNRKTWKHLTVPSDVVNQ